jgi:hypothetical protein
MLGSLCAEPLEVVEDVWPTPSLAQGEVTAKQSAVAAQSRQSVAGEAWDAALDSGGRYAGAVVDVFKVWEWPQRIADFAGGHLASAIYDTENYFGWDNNVEYLKYQFGTAEGWGSLAGMGLAGAVAPQVPRATNSAASIRVADYVRTGPTVVSNQLVHGSGTPGATVTWAIKGGGPGFGFHFHIHRFNWYKPQQWFKQTPIIKPPKQ